METKKYNSIFITPKKWNKCKKVCTQPVQWKLQNIAERNFKRLKQMEWYTMFMDG